MIGGRGKQEELSAILVLRLPKFLLAAIRIPFSGFLHKLMRDYGIEFEVQ